MSYKFIDNFDLALRANIGMTKVTKDTGSNKNMVFQFGVGYRF
jgi:hypothetical protein